MNHGERNACLAAMESCHDLATAQELHSHLERLMRPRGDVYALNKVIDMYGRCGNTEIARSIFNGIHRDSFSWVIMLCAYARNGQLQEAKRIFGQMPEYDVVSWNSLLAAYAQAGHLEDARRLFESMPERSLVSWNLLLSVYARDGDLDEAKRFFDEMPAWSLVSWTTLLVANALHFSWKIFDQMPEYDLVSYNAMIDAFGQRQKTLEAKEAFDRIPEPNLVSWNSMLNAYAQSGHTKDAVALFKNMPEKNLVSWTAMMVAYGSNGDVENAGFVFSLMPEWNLVAYNALLSAYAQAGYLEESKVVFDSMPVQDSVSRTAMLAVYSLQGCLEDAQELYNSIPLKGPVSTNAMISVYTRFARLSLAKNLFDRMPCLSILSWNAMLAAYTHSSKFSSALELFDKMKLVERDFDASTLLLILMACSRAGKVYSGRSIFVSMTRDFGMKANKQHFCCLVDMLGRAGHLDEAESLVSSMPFVPEASDWTCMLGACKSHNAVENGARVTQKLVELDPMYGASYVLLANTFSAQPENQVLQRTSKMLNQTAESDRIVEKENSPNKQLASRSWVFFELTCRVPVPSCYTQTIIKRGFIPSGGERCLTVTKNI